MSEAVHASASSKSSCSTRSSLVRPTPNEIVRDTSLMICPTPILDCAKRGIETGGHVPAANVEPNTGDADLLVVSDHSSHRLRVTEMTVSADNARDNIADQHAI